MSYKLIIPAFVCCALLSGMQSCTHQPEVEPQQPSQSDSAEMNTDSLNLTGIFSGLHVSDVTSYGTNHLDSFIDEIEIQWIDSTTVIVDKIEDNLYYYGPQEIGSGSKTNTTIHFHRSSVGISLTYTKADSSIYIQGDWGGHGHTSHQKLWVKKLP